LFTFRNRISMDHFFFVSISTSTIEKQVENSYFFDLLKIINKNFKFRGE